MPSQSDKPPTPRSIDFTIYRHKGSTAALDFMPKTLQKYKVQPIPSLKEMVRTLSEENGRLREELAYRQTLKHAGEELKRDVDHIVHLDNGRDHISKSSD